MENVINIIQIGFYEGIIWFPIVLAIGLIYSYLKNIDVSIDGIVIISSIGFVASYNYTDSLIIAVLITNFISIISYILVYLLTYKFKINNILVGVIFTLLLHSLSVIFVSESIPIKHEGLLTSNNPGLSLIISLIIFTLVFLFINSRLGIKIIVSADNLNFNTRISPNLSVLAIYAISGLILSFGVILYSSDIGMARSGGGFEFLITSLSSYLFIDKIIEYLLKFWKKNISYGLFKLIKSPVFKAFLGSFLFQVIVLLIIYYTSNPAYWKMIFGLLLIFLVADYKQLRTRKKIATRINSNHELQLVNVNFSYKDNYNTNQVFNSMNINFIQGLNIIWGANGSGKSTLLKLINGSLIPEDGSIILRGRDITLIPSHKRNIFTITQNPYSSLSLNNSVLDNRIATKQYKGFQILGLNFNSSLSLLEYQNTSSLSGGQSQKLNIELCQIFNPDIILADEPTSGMDVTNFESFMNYIIDQEKRNKIILIVTHDNRFKKVHANHIDLKTENYESKLVQ
jgi:ABC-type lipoprotein export system ATPase subunit/ABC-type uncharacterized transport system permease subunit